jgi:hypothetical protein
MPACTSVPLSRDNIIVNIHNLSEFSKHVGILLDQALRQKYLKCAFVNLEDALKAYDLASRQYCITLVVRDRLAEVYKQYAHRIVDVRFISVYTNLRTKHEYLIAGTACDTNAVKQNLFKHLSSIDGVFSGKKVILCNMPERISTGGLDGIIFVDKRFYDKCSDADKTTNVWAKELCQDFVLGFGLRLASPTTKPASYDLAFQTMMKSSAQYVAHIWYKNETQGMIYYDWEKNREDNTDLLRTIYDRLQDARNVEFQMPDDISVDDVIHDLVRCFGVYRQSLWTKLVCIFRDACLSYSPEPEYGNEKPCFNFKRCIDPLGLKQGEQSEERPDFSFDVDILQFVTQVSHGEAFSLMKPTSLASCVRFPSPPIYAQLYRLVQHAQATTCAKVCILTAIIYILSYSSATKFSRPKMNQWLTTYAHVFNQEVRPADVWALQPLSSNNVWVPYYLIFSENDQVVQAANVFKKCVLMHEGEASLPLSYERAGRQLDPQYEFTSNQLIARVMSSDATPKDILASIDATSPKSNLQMLGIVVNEGNTRPFVVAVLQELVQNAIDAIRSSSAFAHVELDFEKSQETGKLVMAITDPVGMTLDTLLKMNIPFYSGKTSKDANTTGEMGTGFFNVFRETSRVFVKTQKNSQIILWESTPIVEDKRVVDILNKVWFEEELFESASSFTTIRLFLNSDVGADEQFAVFEATMRDMLPVINPDIVTFTVQGKSLDAQPHIMRTSVEPGMIRMSDKGFQRGSVCVTVNNYPKSYVLSNGVPFTDLVHFCSMIGFDAMCSQVLYSNFVIDLPKQAYTVVQSREKIFLEESSRADVILALQDCCWVSCIHKMAKDARYVVGHGGALFDWPNVDFLARLSCRLHNLKSSGDISQTLKPGPPTRYNRLFQNDKQGLKGVFESYRFFAPVGEQDDKSHPALIELLQKAAQQTLARGETNEVKLQASAEAAQHLPTLVRLEVETILKAWLVLKRASHNVEASLGNDVVEYLPGSLPHTLVKAFIDVYVKYGVSAKITGFTPGLVSEVRVQYNRDEAASYFEPFDQSVTIAENTADDDKGAFANLARVVYQMCLDTTDATLVDFETCMKLSNHSMYESFFGSRRGFVLHEIEHARRNSSCTKDTGHPDVHVSFQSEPKQTRTFVQCMEDAAKIIVNHQVDHVSFVTALTTTWKTSLGPLVGTSQGSSAVSPQPTSSRHAVLLGRDDEDKSFSRTKEGSSSEGGGGGLGKGTSAEGGLGKGTRAEGGLGKGTSAEGGGGGGGSKEGFVYDFSSFDSNEDEDEEGPSAW